MPSASVSNSILTSVQSIITNLGLSIGGSLINVQVRKLPKEAETVDPLPLIAIVRDEKGEATEFWTFLETDIKYPVDVVLIASNNNDNVGNLDAYQTIMQTIRLTFAKLATVTPMMPPTVYDLDILEGTFIDRAAVSDKYDYLEFRLMFSSNEFIGR